MEQKLKKLTKDITNKTQKEMEEEFYKESMNLYRDITNVFIINHVELSDSFVIAQTLANAIKTYMYGYESLLGVYKKEEIYSEICKVFIEKKTEVNLSFLVMQAIADSVYMKLTGEVNPFSMQVFDMI